MTNGARNKYLETCGASRETGILFCNRWMFGASRCSHVTVVWHRVFLHCGRQRLSWCHISFDRRRLRICIDNFECSSRVRVDAGMGIWGTEPHSFRNSSGPSLGVAADSSSLCSVPLPCRNHSENGSVTRVRSMNVDLSANDERFRNGLDPGSCTTR